MNICAFFSYFFAFLFGMSIAAFTKTWKEGCIVLGLYLLTQLFANLK